MSVKGATGLIHLSLNRFLYFQGKLIHVYIEPKKLWTSHISFSHASYHSINYCEFILKSKWCLLGLFLYHWYVNVWGWFNITISYQQYRDFHYKDEMVMRLSHLYNRNPYTGKTTFLRIRIIRITFLFNVLRWPPDVSSIHFCADIIIKCGIQPKYIWWEQCMVTYARVALVREKSGNFVASQGIL